MEDITPYDELYSEYQELQYQLAEAKDTIDAIRNGKVDALIVKGTNGHQLFTLKNSDQTYRVFIEKMAEGAVTLNHDGIILYCNSRFARLINLPLETVIGQPLDSFVAAPSIDVFKKLISYGWEHDCKSEIFFLVNGSKEPKTCLVSCNTLVLDEGKALSVIITDLTQQKEIQKELKLKNEQLEEARANTQKLNNELEETVKKRTLDLFDSREHFKSLANNLPQMIWTNLPNGEVNFRNLQWHRYTGLSDTASSDKKWETIVHPDDAEETDKRFGTALKTGYVFEVENRYKQADGVYRWHLNRGIPLRNDAGEIVLWVGTATDIEDQKRAMEKKDEFIGIASHELKTPLTSLKGYLEIIGSYKGEALPPAVKSFINKSIEAVSKLQYLINDLLDVSKINAGKLLYQMDAVDVKKLINTCLDNSRHIYPDYQIENKQDKDFFVNGNIERLEQVVMNFISNAVKYSPINKQIILSAEQIDNQVRISVKDFGIGLSTAHKEKIFERFYRVEDKKFAASGLGMGLYICSEIVKAHHGSIGVTSEFGTGSIFYVDLPLLLIK